MVQYSFVPQVRKIVQIICTMVPKFEILVRMMADHQQQQDALVRMMADHQQQQQLDLLLMIRRLQQQQGYSSNLSLAAGAILQPRKERGKEQQLGGQQVLGDLLGALDLLGAQELGSQQLSTQQHAASTAAPAAVAGIDGGGRSASTWPYVIADECRQAAGPHLQAGPHFREESCSACAGL